MNLEVDRWNPAAERMFGWTKYEVLGRPTPLVPPELMAEAEAHRVRIFNGETFANVETVRRRKDGTVVNVSVSAAAIYNSEGEAAGMVAMFADISGRKRDREALQRSSARLEALVAASPLAIIVQDEHGVIKRWNEAAHRIFGWTEQEAIGQKMLAVPAEKMAEGTDFRERIMRGEHFADVEAVRRRKDGSDVPVSLSAAPLRDAMGKANGMVLLAADISERKRSELRQDIQKSVTVLLAEASSVEEVIPRVIQTLCEGLGWVAGARRIVAKDDGLMRHTEDWGLRRAGHPAFSAAVGRARRYNRRERRPAAQGMGGRQAGVARRYRAGTDVCARRRGGGGGAALRVRISNSRERRVLRRDRVVRHRSTPARRRSRQDRH